MEMTLKPYPEYQDSGQEWLGQVPAHWSVLPNRALFREIKDQNQPEEPLLSVTISRGVIPQDVLLADSAKKDSSNLDKSKYKLVEPGDIAYNKMRAWQGALGVSEYRGIVSPAYIIVRPRQEVDPRYFHYLLRTPAFVKEAERWSYGITSDMWSLRYEDFKQIYCVLPPLDEQRQMARYLDQQFRCVGRLIRAKQRLIALLNEQKQAIIQRAVTRGLDPDVSLKPSGVDWLGDVPAHWEVRRLKAAIADHANGIWGDEPDGHNDIICVRVADFDWFKRRVDISNPTLRSVSPSQRSGRLLNPGDLLIEKSGGGDLTPVGRVVLYDHDAPAVCSNFVARIRPRRDVALPGYLCLLFYMLHFAGRNILSIKQTTGIQNLDAGSYFAETVPLPPISEQEAILNEMEVVVNRIDASIKTASDEIILIREYRTRLIADVVTGKLDVRGVVVPEGEGDGGVAEVDVAEDDESTDEDVLTHVHD